MVNFRVFRGFGILVFWGLCVQMVSVLGVAYSGYFIACWCFAFELLVSCFLGVCNTEMVSWFILWFLVRLWVVLDFAVLCVSAFWVVWMLGYVVV